MLKLLESTVGVYQIKKVLNTNLQVTSSEVKAEVQNKEKNQLTCSEMKKAIQASKENEVAHNNNKERYIVTGKTDAKTSEAIERLFKSYLSDEKSLIRCMSMQQQKQNITYDNVSVCVLKSYDKKTKILKISISTNDGGYIKTLEKNMSKYQLKADEMEKKEKEEAISDDNPNAPRQNSDGSWTMVINGKEVTIKTPKIKTK